MFEIYDIGILPDGISAVISRAVVYDDNLFLIGDVAGVDCLKECTTDNDCGSITSDLSYTCEELQAGYNFCLP